MQLADYVEGQHRLMSALDGDGSVRQEGFSGMGEGCSKEPDGRHRDDGCDEPIEQQIMMPSGSLAGTYQAALLKHAERGETLLSGKPS